MPVLLHRIRNTTQLLSGVNALLAVDAARPLSPVRADDLIEAARQAEELGWLLGVLSGGLGAELAESRRVSGGLAATLELVRDALRRTGAELTLPCELPEIGSPPRPASLCLSVAGLVWHASRGAERTALAVEPAGEAWLLRLTGAQPCPEFPERDLLSAIPAARFEVEASGWRLELPPDWLASRGALPAGPARRAGPAGRTH